MDDEKLKRCLESIGKRCFRNCYKIAFKRRDSITIEDLIRHDSELEGTSLKALRTRLSCIKRIFRAGCAEKALHMAEQKRF